MGVVEERELRGKVILAGIALYVWKPLNLQRGWGASHRGGKTAAGGG